MKRLVVFSSSVVNQEHNPIGETKRPDPLKWERELINQFKRYFIFAKKANDLQNK